MRRRVLQRLKSGFDDGDLLVDLFDRGAEIDPASGRVPELFADPLAMSENVPESLLIVEADIAVHDQLDGM